MRVLHLTTHLNIGGITTYIERLIKPLQPYGIETFVLSSGGERTPEFHEAGATTFQLPIKTKNELHPKLFLALPELIKIIRENKIDILHAHTRITQVLATLAGRFTHVPVVTTYHGFYKIRLGRRLFPCYGDRTIAISGMVKDHLVNDFKIPEDQVRLILNAVNLEELETAYNQKNPGDAKKTYGFQPQDPVVGITARLVGDKGHEYLIKAIPILRAQFPNIRLLIVGDGRFRSQLEHLVFELKIDDRVHFTGNVGDITLPLAAMDVFALPATWREGFGLSIVEAMACRRPIVVSNIWSLNTLIHDGKTGLMVEPKQPQPLADAIARLLQDKALSNEMTARAHTLVKEHFGIHRMAKEISATYQELSPRKP